MLTVILKDIGQVRHGQVACSRANCLEGGVVGGEYSNVHGSIKSVDKIGLGQGASDCAQASLLGGEGDILWECQDLVDNVHNTTGEVDVLRTVSKCH